MVLVGELAIRLLDVVGFRVARDAEHLVVVLEFHAAMLRHPRYDVPHISTVLCSPSVGGVPVIAAFAILNSWTGLLSFTSQYSAL